MSSCSAVVSTSLRLVPGIPELKELFKVSLATFADEQPRTIYDVCLKDCEPKPSLRYAFGLHRRNRAPLRVVTIVDAARSSEGTEETQVPSATYIQTAQIDTHNAP